MAECVYVWGGGRMRMRKKDRIEIVRVSLRQWFMFRCFYAAIARNVRCSVRSAREERQMGGGSMKVPARTQCDLMLMHRAPIKCVAKFNCFKIDFRLLTSSPAWEWRQAAIPQSLAHWRIVRYVTRFLRSRRHSWLFFALFRYLNNRRYLLRRVAFYPISIQLPAYTHDACATANVWMKIQINCAIITGNHKSQIIFVFAFAFFCFFFF